MRKRIASLFLVLALCLSLLPTAALAEEIPETTPGDTIPASESAQEPEVDETVEDVRSAIDALPSAEDWADLTAEEQKTAAEDASAAYEAYEELTEEQQTALSGELEKLIALFGKINSEVAPSALGGKGTEAEPYVISNASDCVTVLSNARLYLNKKFIELGADIDLSGQTWNANSLQNSTFDGQGHCIKNAGQPLFSGLSDSTVKNLAIVGADITGSNTTGAGILANFATGTNTIENCYINGSVKFQCNNGNYGVGGMLGAVESGASVTIENCAIDATVENTSTGSGARGAGGFVGIVKGSNVLTISNCYATGSVITGSKFAGGLVGAALHTDTTITIKNSVALQSEVSNGKLKSCEGRIVSSADYFKTNNLTNNYAYADMKGAKQDGEKYTAGSFNGENVSKKECTTAKFWTDLRFDSSIWAIEDNKLPCLTNLSAMTGNPPTYLLDAASCPVGLGEDKTVAVTFQTTDADTAKKTDSITITITNSGSASLALDAFKLSSLDSASVPINGLSVSALEDNTLTITMAKSVTADTAYLFYRSYCLGAITLEKTVSKVSLPAPTNAKWDTTVPGKATWDSVANAAKYSVQLYKNDAAQDTVVTTKNTSNDFTSVIADTGSYTFKVKALGDDTYSDSTEATSDVYDFTQQTLADVKTSAEAALAAMSVSNATTADEVLKVVTDRITYKKIHAAWSASDPFAKVNATDGADSGTDGHITGEIVLTLDSTQETITVSLTIQPKFAVTFASDSTSAVGPDPTQETVTAGTKITLPANPYTYYGMNFTGWNDGTHTYQASSFYTMPAHNVTFTAQWTNDVWDGAAKSDLLKGSGTADDPYIIASGADLNYLSNWDGRYCDRYYKLMADIDMGNHEMLPIYRLTGTFDGNGHKITNLKIESSDVYYGLFKDAGNSGTAAVIKNLTLENATINDTKSTNSGKLGLLVSRAGDYLTIEDCYVTGSITTASKPYMDVGGLVGQAQGANVTISRCYAGVTFIGGHGNSFFGGLVGSCEGGTTIKNCYAISNMTGVTAGHCGGITSSTGGTIQNCYAAGAAFSGAGIAGNAANISGSVSIFPEMRGSARIFSSSSSGIASNNYGFDGTIQRDSNGIVTPPAAQFAADKAQGANATADQLKSFGFYKNTLGWSEDVWEIRSGYGFPVLKGQKTVPTLTLDMTPSVDSITLDKSSATLPCGGTVQLTATVDVKNGAARTVTWTSSDPSKAVVDSTGKVTIPKDAASGEVTITATATADASRIAICTVTVDADSHNLTSKRDTTVTNSPKAVCTFYASAEDAQAGRNPIMTAKAGTKVFARITQMDQSDIVSSGTKVNGVSAARLNMSTIYFTMPCEDAKVVFSCAEWLNATNYVWFVGSDWGTWGETVTYTTQEWSRSDHIGSLKITNIINGKLFDSFEIKGMTACDAAKKTESSLTPNKKSSQTELKNPGDYFVDQSGTYPVLYVYNDKPGTIMVDIKVKDNPDAVYNITKEAASAGYYTLDTTSAKAGETVTATLTEAGIAAIGTNQSMTLDYYGGLLIVLFPGQFQKGTDGKWTTTFTMPAQDITTRAYASIKQEVTLTGTDKTVEYNGQPQTIDSAITATLGTTNLSEALQGRYVVTYNGSTTAPTNVGTYTCKVRLPANDPLYSGEMTETVTLTIEKSTPKVPAAPLAQSRAESSITLARPTAFADGSAIPEGYTLEYKRSDGSWQDSLTFTGLEATTAYTFYARIKKNNNTNASEKSAGSTIYTLPAAPAADVVTIDFAGEKISFDASKYEMRTTSSFASGEEITSGASITAQIGQTVYIRVKAMNVDEPSEATAVAIPARPDAPVPTINFKAETLTVSPGERYKIGSGDYTEGSGNAESITSSIPAADASAVTVTYYLKATTTAFKSVEKTLTIPARPAAPAVPTAETTQATSLTLEAVAGAEYKLGDGNWQTDTTFTGLTAKTRYAFSQRLAATDTAFASEPSQATLTTADKDTVTFTLPAADQSFAYDKAGKTPGMASASVSGITLEVRYIGTNGTAYDSAEAPVNAGTYQAVYKVPDNNPAYQGTSDPVTFTIGKRAITVKADDKSMTVGGTLPEFTVSYGNFADGDGAETVFATPATATTTADGKTTGSFEIAVTAPTLTGEAAKNYEIAAPEKGVLTVSQRSYSGGGSSSPSYPVTTPDKTENGTVTVSPRSAEKGDSVTITVKPDSGYQLDDLTVTDKNGKELKLADKGNGKYTFTMPAGKVEISAAFVEEVEVSPFSDVSTSAYYYEAVKWAQKKGITGGIGNGLFGPNQPCTRAQIVTFLWRAAGSPEPKSMNNFSDVSADSYYAKAVAWAVENGITTGTGDGRFSPDATCTRAQSVTFLFRAIGKLVDSKAEFSDVLTDSYYANAVAWAVENGVTNGIGDGLFGPNNSCTRAQIVTFLFRAYQGK